MSLAGEVERGIRASRLLSEPILIEAFASVEQAIHESWAASPIRDYEGQNQLRLMLKLLGDVRGVLETAMDDGKMAAAKLEELNKRRPLSPKEFFGQSKVG